MSKHLSEAPWLPFPPAEVMSNRGPALLAHQAERHGPVLRWTMPHGALAGREFVFLVGPEANRFVLHTHRASFSHEQGWTPYIGPLLGKGLLNMDPPEHTRHRKLWNPAFTNAYMERYLPLIQRVIAQHTARWLEQGEVDLYQAMRELTFHVAASALVGLEHSQRIEQLQKLFYTLLGFRFRARVSSFQNYDEHLPKALRAREELSGLLLELIAERRSRPVDQPSGDVLGLILQARDEDGERLDDEQVLGHLDILLLAGHETTSTLSAYVLYLLATLPEHRRRIETELQAILGDSTGPISVGATREMKTLDNFIAETGRLYSPVFTVPRQVVQDVEFADYTLPAGTIVRLALAAGHHLPGVFADPEAFDPDRFAPPREGDRRTPYGLVTFGGGPRLCIGVHFATVVKNGIPMGVTARHRASHDATSEGL
jgi:retinoid hydroxylase